MPPFYYRLIEYMPPLLVVAKLTCAIILLICTLILGGVIL